MMTVVKITLALDICGHTITNKKVPLVAGIHLSAIVLDHTGCLMEERFNGSAMRNKRPKLKHLKEMLLKSLHIVSNRHKDHIGKNMKKHVQWLETALEKINTLP